MLLKVCTPSCDDDVLHSWHAHLFNTIISIYLTFFLFFGWGDTHCPGTAVVNVQTAPFPDGRGEHRFSSKDHWLGNTEELRQKVASLHSLQHIGCSWINVATPLWETGNSVSVARRFNCPVSWYCSVQKGAFSDGDKALPQSVTPGGYTVCQGVPRIYRQKKKNWL